MLDTPSVRCPTDFPLGPHLRTHPLCRSDAGGGTIVVAGTVTNGAGCSWLRSSPCPPYHLVGTNAYVGSCRVLRLPFDSPDCWMRHNSALPTDRPICPARHGYRE